MRQDPAVIDLPPRPRGAPGDAALYEFLHDALPADHCRQVQVETELQARVVAGLRAAEVLDFGCGDGRSIDLFRKLLPQSKWTGVDIEASPEVASRRRTDGHFVSYDGYELPFADRSFDLVYTKQVLEHVRKPELALREMARVLTPDGLLIGQTSQFEPYHSYSLWNFTVYGFKRIAEDAGLQVAMLRPGIDGFTLMRRTYEGRPAEMSRYFAEESPVNQEIEAQALAQGKAVRVRNHRKLMYCGQFVFVLRRAGMPAAGRPRPAQATEKAKAPPVAAVAAPVLPTVPPFEGSTAYWQWRYDAGLDSGTGSYGKFADFKAEVLNGLARELHLRSAVEFGCGDGHQLSLLQIEDYLGVDVSAQAIERCRTRFAGAPSRRFVLDADYRGERAQCAWSLDVIYHLVEDAVFERYMRRLFDAATDLVVIYASDFDQADAGAPHVRHRRFSAWIAREAPRWRLWRRVPNRHPWRGDHREGSFADFHLYRPAEAGPVVPASAGSC